MKKDYKFWGWEHADVFPADKNYSFIKDPRNLYDILSKIWCAGTCAPRMREKWTPDNKTLGQCSITAFLAQDIFGGKVYGIKRPDGNVHCFNVVGDCRFDLTSEQSNSLIQRLHTPMLYCIMYIHLRRWPYGTGCNKILG